MKKNFILLYGLAVLMFSACKKGFLDRTPLDQYSESSLWTSANDAQAALNGCYSGWESGTWLFYMDCGSDNAFDPYPWEGYTMYGNMGLLTPTNTGNQKWNFQTIEKCNWFLASIDKTPMDEDLKKNMKAEARFLRAYKYFVMSQLYGDVPLITSNISTAEANTVRRTPKDSVVQFVLAELDTAQANLPDSYSGADVGRVTKGAAWALKARVELFNQQYENCIASCGQVMGKYSLFNSYADLFRIQNEHNPEIILDVEYIADDVPETDLGVMVPESSGGWWSVDPTQALVDAYEMSNGKTITDPSSGYNPDDPYKNRDPRLQATVFVPGSLYEGNYFDPLNPNSIDYYAAYGYTGYADRKFMAHLSDYPNMWNAGLDIPVIRYAEVLLSYAEAKIELNQIDNTVYDAINQVRLRAGMPAVDETVYNTQETMRTLVRRERRVELAMEGLRWFDVQRWGIAEQVMSGTVYGSRLGTVDPADGHLTLTTDRILVEQRTFDKTKNYLWPIPQSQLDIDKNLSQNPNY
jgi:hypothetical protein